MYLVLVPHCMTEILAKECKSGKSTVLALGTVPPFGHLLPYHYYPVNTQVQYFINLAITTNRPVKKRIDLHTQAHSCS